jgi:hypothetical protein
MKIDYVATGSRDCPLVRISETMPEECRRLTALLYALSMGELREGAIQELAEHPETVEAHLVIRTGKRDIGVVQVGPEAFECTLKDTTWDNVAGLVEPFCDGHSGFQWLDDSSGIRLLLSPTGEW